MTLTPFYMLNPALVLVFILWQLMLIAWNDYLSLECPTQMFDLSNFQPPKCHILQEILFDECKIMGFVAQSFYPTQVLEWEL